MSQTPKHLNRFDKIWLGVLGKFVAYIKIKTMRLFTVSTALRFGLPLFALTAFFSFTPPRVDKKVKEFYVERIIDLPAETIWKIVGEDYGSVAYSHPKIISSNYINGSLEAKEGAERVCHFNEKGTQFLRERMTDYDPENMRFTNQVFQAGKFPVDPEYTHAVYKVESLGENQCRLSFDMQFRTKPAMMGGMMKGSFRNLMNDYLISVEHHARTGEKVTQDNFKSIKKQYQ